MNKVEFNYNDIKFIVQCNKEDKMKEVINKFLNKSGKNKKNIFFIYNGQIINEDLIFNKCANSLDRNRNYMNVLVLESQIEEVSNLIKSNYIICPKCYEDAHISLNNFKINISGCKSEHETKNLQLDEFIKTQYKDISNIKCDKCGSLRSDANDFKFFLCLTCQQNLCQKCLDSHDKSHNIKDYEENHFYCQSHFDKYIYYCSNCKKDICKLCENEHKNHKLINYDSIMPDIDILRKDEIDETKEKIYQLKTIVNGMINELNHLNKNLDTYFEIFSNTVSNFEIDKRNYFILENINVIKKFNDNFIGRITEIIKDNNLKSQFISIINLKTQIEFKKNQNIEVHNQKELDNIKNKIDKSEENNNINNKENIDSLNGKYENFNINEIQELYSFTTQNNVKNILVLNDKRLITHQEYFNEKGEAGYKLCVYSTTNGFICDINIDFGDISKLFLMDDGNVIMAGDKLQIVKINKNNIEEIWNHDNDISIKKRFFYTNTFLVDKKEKKPGAEITNVWSFLANVKFSKELYSYENGKLIFYKNINKLYKKEKIGDICKIKDNEFVFYITQKGKIYGENDYIIFYDIQSDEKINSLKVGNGENIQEMYLANKENLLISKDYDIIILVDTINRKIKKEFKFKISIQDLYYLNEKIFLYPQGSAIFQYEFEDSNNIILKGKKDIPTTLISKYPENKLIIYKKRKIIIYGSK